MSTAHLHRTLYASLASLLLTAFLSVPTQADTFQWTAAADGDWSDPLNWFDNQPPAVNGASVVFENTISGGTGITSTIDANWSATGTVNSLTFMPGSQTLTDNGNLTLASGAGVSSFTIGTGGLNLVNGRNRVELADPVTLGANQTWRFVRPVADSNLTAPTNYSPRLAIAAGLDAASPGTTLTLQGNQSWSQSIGASSLTGQLRLIGPAGSMGANVARINLQGTHLRLGEDGASALADANGNRIANNTTIASYGGGLIVFRQGNLTEDLGALRLEQGAFRISGNVASGAGTSVYRFASFDHRDAGATMVLDSGTTSANQINFQFADASGLGQVNGIIGGWAVGRTQQGGTRFLAPAADNTTLTTIAGTNVPDTATLNAVAPTANINLTAAASLTGNLTINSLRNTFAGTLDLAGFTLRVVSGGFIDEAPFSGLVINNGSITGGATIDTPATLYFHQRIGGTNTPFGANSSIINNGTGVVNVVYTGDKLDRFFQPSGINTYTGFTAANGIELRFSGSETAGNPGQFGTTPTVFVADSLRLNDVVGWNNGGVTLHANRGILLGGGGLTWRQITGVGYIDGAIAGSGQLTVTQNTLQLRGSMSNTYSGATIVSGQGSAATLVLGKQGGATAVAGDLIISRQNSGGTWDSIAQLNASNQIANTSTITQIRPEDTVGGTGKARFRLNGQSDTIAGLIGDAADPAAMIVENNHASAASTLTFAPGAGAYYSYEGILQNRDTVGGGTLALVLDGHATGRQALSGNNTYSGGTTINGGTLIAAGNNALGTGTVAVNGGVLALLEGITVMTPVTFNSGSTLAGNGTLGVGGNLTAPANFTVAPGFSTGKLTIDVGAGNTLAMNSTTTTEIEIADLTDFDLLAVTGNASLAGTLSVTLLDGYLPVRGTTFDVITSTGTMTGLVGLGGPDGMWFSSAIIDGNILRLTSQIPEPASALLLALAGLATLRRRR